MKKIIASVLCLVMLVSALAMTSCQDPLQDKLDEFDEVYAKLADTFYLTYEAAAFTETDKEGDWLDKSVKNQLDDWKKQIRSAKNAWNSRLDYTEQEIQVYIAEWNGLIGDMNEMYDKYDDAINAAKQEAAGFQK